MSGLESMRFSSSATSNEEKRSLHLQTMINEATNVKDQTVNFKFLQYEEEIPKHCWNEKGLGSHVNKSQNFLSKRQHTFEMRAWQKQIFPSFWVPPTTKITSSRQRFWDTQLL